MIHGHSVVISVFLTIWDTVVLFELRHLYFRKGTSTMMIWSKYTINWTQWIWDHGQNQHRCCSMRKSFCRTIVSGYWAVVWYRKNGLPEYSTTQVWRATSDANAVARRPFRAISGNRAYGVVKACINSSPPSAAYMHQWTGLALPQINTMTL